MGVKTINKYLDAKAVKGYATGRWSEIIRSLAPQLIPTIERGNKHGPCGLCGGEDRARCHNDFQETGGIICNQCRGGADGFSILMLANGWKFPEALHAVTNYLGIDGDTFAATPLEAKPSHSKDWTGERTQLARIWSESEINSIRLSEYLEHRELSVDTPQSLRLHPKLYHYQVKAYYPVMIARIIRGSTLVGLHRTFLDPRSNGKAPVQEPKLAKKCADSMSGGAIRLFPAKSNTPLVLCEGIETGLAVHQQTGWPVWPCVSSIMLEKVLLPDEIRDVFIAADKDRSGAGEHSSMVLAKRLSGEGRRVKICLPPNHIQESQTSLDWLDHLRKEPVHV